MSIHAHTSSAAAGDRVLSRVRKLLALSTSRNEHEAALALQKATQLLQEYNLDLAQVGALDSISSIEEMASDPLRDTGKGTMFRAREKWIVVIASSIAESNMCRVILRTDRICFVGPVHQLAPTVFMFNSIFAQITHLLREELKHYVRSYKERTGVSPIGVPGVHNVVVYRRSWLLGAAYTLQERLQEQTEHFRGQRRQISTSGTVTGQELIVIAQDSIEQYFREKHPLWFKPDGTRRRSSLYTEASSPALLNITARQRGVEQARTIHFASGALESSD